MYVFTNEDGRILVTTEHEEYTDDTYFEFTFPDDFDFSKQDQYVIKDNELILDPPPKSEEEIEAEKEAKRRTQLETATLLFVRTNASTLSDEEALNVSLLFETWDELDHFVEGHIYQYGDDIYRCLQDHDKQESWTPDQAHSLWVRVRPEGEILEWEPVQPGINEPYKKGDKVTHNGKTWESLIDNNVWEPGAVGSETLWKEVS